MNEQLEQSLRQAHQDAWNRGYRRHKQDGKILVEIVNRALSDGGRRETLQEVLAWSDFWRSSHKAIIEEFAR